MEYVSVCINISEEKKKVLDFFLLLFINKFCTVKLLQLSSNRDLCVGGGERGGTGHLMLRLQKLYELSIFYQTCSEEKLIFFCFCPVLEHLNHSHGDEMIS